MTALETTKVAAFKTVEPFKLSDPTKAAIANGIAGMTASLCSQGVFVPIDVISQRLMVQGYSGHTSYNGGLDVARKVLKQDGVRGLYRGFGLSVMTYSPSSAVWWASYGSSQRFIWSLLGHGNDGNGSIPSQGTIVLVQGAGGISAAAAASLITAPLDKDSTTGTSCFLFNIVMGHEKRPSTRQVIKTLITEDGWKGFYKGIGPRFFSMSAWGTSMILAYEYLNGAGRGRRLKFDHTAYHVLSKVYKRMHLGVHLSMIMICIKTLIPSIHPAYKHKQDVEAKNSQLKQQKRDEVFLKDRIPMWFAESGYIGLAAISTATMPLIFQPLKWYFVAVVFVGPQCMIGEGSLS